MEPKRLNKFISDSGFCSRREADTLIEQERVTVNGKVPQDAGVKVTSKDKVRIDGEILRVREEKPVYLAMNKPSNMSANSDPSVRNNVVRAINYPASLEPAGMLEREAEGLIFLSNDTEFVSLLKRADNKFEKEYVVSVDKIITPEFLNKISGGTPEPGEVTRFNAVSKESSMRFRITLQPGTDHYLKRLCENLGYRVVHLQRLRFGNTTLSKMASGHWRTLTPEEVEDIRTIAATRVARPVKEFKSRSKRAEELEERTAAATLAKESEERSRGTSSRVGQDRTVNKRKPSKDFPNPKSRDARAGSKNFPGKKSDSKAGGRKGAAPKGSSGPSKRSR